MIKIVKVGVPQRLNDIVALLKDKIPLHKRFAEIGLTDIEEHFIFEDGPKGKWAPLSEFTIAKKGHDRILYESGTLVNSFITRANNDYGEVKSDGTAKNPRGVNYGWYHDRKSGFVNWVTKKRTPARTFMWISKSARMEMKRALIEYVKGISKWR